MKTLNIKQMMRKIGAALLIGFMLVLTTACGSEKSIVSEDTSAQGNTSQPSGPYVPPGSLSGADAEVVFDYGASAPITLHGSSDTQKNQTLSSYVGEPRYNISNLALNVNIVKRGNGFGGQVAIGYYDNDANTQRTGVFKNGDEEVYWNTSLEDAAQYNIWFEKSGDLYFHGFFQDNQGGIIIVIDEFVSSGDGSAPTHVSGSVWYKNFQIFNDPYNIMPPHPPTHCWLVSIGPYDCRSWKEGHAVDTTQGILPTDGYKKLGTFQGLELDVAFNGEDLGL